MRAPSLRDAASRPPLAAALYNVLNFTGWESFPTSCWLFPQHAITLVYSDVAYQVALLADDQDTSAGRIVADAWCQ